jgi:phosphatidate phosphatase APP1
MEKPGKNGTNLTPGETVVLYPTFGHLVEDGRAWRIAVQGTVFEAGQVGFRKRLLLRLLRRVMQARPEDLDTEIFQRRIQGFIAATEKGKRVSVRVGPRSQILRRASNRSGYFSGAIRIAIDELHAVNGGPHTCWVNLETVDPHPRNGHRHAQVQLLKNEGISVISDIDDTIKHSEVTCRQSLLANTFLNEFRSIDGMAELYRSWADRGIDFHYVSSSPWQLFQPLHDHCLSAGFPPGSFHLRSFRLRDHMLRRLLRIRRRGKATVIRAIVSLFPLRRFVLIGDSGEKDPEIYSDVARRFPDRVIAIFIRNLASHPLDVGRAEKVLRGIPPGKLLVFEHADQLRERLPC